MHMPVHVHHRAQTERAYGRTCRPADHLYLTLNQLGIRSDATLSDHHKFCLFTGKVDGDRRLVRDGIVKHHHIRLWMDGELRFGR